jgi:hypothetical protein
MPDEKTIADLTAEALRRNEWFIQILTTFLQEASVLVLVFGILDTYASNKLTVRVGVIVAGLGLTLLVAAFAVRSIFYRFLRRGIRNVLTMQESSAMGGSE